MAFCHLSYNREEIRCSQRHGYSGALGCRPQPVDSAICRPGALMRLIEREAQAEHPRPVLPTINQRAALRAIKGEVPQDREPIGMLACGLDRQLVGIRVPSGRMDHGCVDTGLIHLPQ
jgi:hypothetical protein